MRTEELRKNKAKQLRYKKPIVKDLNLWSIREELDDIECECDEVRWYCESEDGSDSLINALDGDEDEAYEFRMAFADLSAECLQMREDLNNAYVPECFDTLMVSSGAGNYYGGYLGYDTYEHDYYGLDVPEDWIKGEAGKRLSAMTKKELIECMGACNKILFAYLGLHYRYDSLKSALDIIRNENTGVLKTVSKINELYEKNESELFSPYSETGREIEELGKALPAMAWIS